MKNKFSKEGVWMANKHMKRCPTSLAVREMQVKTTTAMYTSIRVAKIKNSTKTKRWSGCKKFDHSCIAGGNAKCFSYFQNHVTFPL